MVSFRKALLLLTALVVFTGVVSAQAPATCQAYTSNVPTVRAEGVAEEVGQVVIDCMGGTSKPRGTALYPNNVFNLQIYLNTNVTSRRTASSGTALEALLLIDEPSPAQVTSNRVCSASNAATTPLPASCQAVAVGGGVYYDSVIVNPNVFQGRLLANNSILWTGIPFDAPGTTPKRIFRIVNVRANASALAPGSALIPGALQMFISVSGTAAPQLTNSQLTVAYVQDGMQFRAGAGSTSDNGKVFLQCEVSDGSYGASTVQKFRLRYTERFPTAFEDAILADGGNQADLTRFYNTEHMYVHPAVSAALGGLPGVALDGLGQRYVPTRLLANFSNIPTNVRLRVPRLVCSTSGGECFQYVLCTDNTGSNCTTTTLGSGDSIAIDNIVGGLATLVYEQYASNSTNIADVVIPVELRWGPNSSLPGPPGTGTVTVQGSYAPTTTTLTSIFGPAPRFLVDPADVVSFRIDPCRTNLLFPYVTNQGGFDTGLVIANTSADKFGTVPQSGTCTLDYFGTTGASGAAPASITTETVNAGSLLIGTLAFGGNLGMPAAKEFQGYIIAKCNFQYAHGFAYLYSGPTFEGSMGYLALVLDSDKGVITGTIDGTSITLNPPTSRTGSISEARNQ